MTDRSRDWLAQAKRDLQHAAKDVQDRYFEHACFEAQQAAEKAVKALYMRLHCEAWGYRVAKLLETLKDVNINPSIELITQAKLIDQYYIPARYPNGFESGAPMDFYTEGQAADAVNKAETIIVWCDSILSTI